MTETAGSGRRAAVVSMAVLLGTLAAIQVLPDQRSLGILSLIVLHGILYLMTLAYMASRVERTVEILSDGRFYLFTMLLIYAVTVPLLSLVDGYPARNLSLLPHIRTRVSSEATIMYSQAGSIVLYAGAFLGAFLVWRHSGRGAGRADSPARGRDESPQPTALTTGLSAATWYWTAISAVSTFVFCIPFLMGGFDVLRRGGTVIDIDGFSAIAGGSLPLTLIGFLFSAEVMTGSTLVLMAVLYLRYRKGGGTLALVLLVGFHLALALVTTRTIRAVIFVFAICVLASLPGPAKGRKPLTMVLAVMPVLVVAIGALNLAPSLLDESNANYDAPTSLADLLRSADPSGPYDAYFRALEQEPIAGMAANAVVSFVSSLPFIGGFLLESFGVDPTPPLADWMRSEYPEIYGVGGGLAAMPQIEAYLTAGIVGCFATGAIMGTVSRLSRTVLGSLFVVALSVLFARGSLGILAQLAVPYGLVVVLFFGVVVPKLMRLPSIGVIRDGVEEVRARSGAPSTPSTAGGQPSISAQHYRV